MKINENFKKIRQEKGFTQEQFADVLHVDGSAISKIALASLIEEDVTYFFTYPKRYVDADLVNAPERISVTFEVSPDKRDILLKLVTGQDSVKL